MKGQSTLLCGGGEICDVKGVGDVKESSHKRAIRTSAGSKFG